MSDTVLAFVLTIVLLAALFLWVPLLHSVASLRRRRPLQLAAATLPELEDEPGALLAGEAAGF